MNEIIIPYPPAPKGVDEKIIQPSEAFRKDVIRTIGAIMFFIFVYLLLVAGAIGLAVLAVIGGVLLITTFPRFITLMLGVGLIGMSLLVIYFLIKFMFSRNKVDRSDLIKVNEDEQPELFAFIRRLTSETQTPFPKAIYLSNDVNACVFYDSGFWSMFLPVRKNLQIGLGLVNSVNISEFKAILAHEFGHFSQRSMKLGSYTYNVNKVIYNMLYDNNSYEKTLESFANASGYFSLFAQVTVAIIEAIQSLLKKMYEVVNKSYLSLSRQMEFHADSVAAYVSGSAPLITSLRRLEAADLCYNNLFGRYNAWVKENNKALNLYTQHTEVMRLFAQDHEIPFEHSLPQVSATSFNKFYKSRIEIKNQWASHPEIEEREAHLKKLNVPCEVMHEPAWIIFRNAEAIQQEVTAKIFSDVKFEKEPMPLDTKGFVEKILKERNENNFNKRYKGFYDLRNVTVFDPESERQIETKDEATDFDSLFTDNNTGLPAVIRGLQGDINLLEQLEKNPGSIKTFDFDGLKYSVLDAKRMKEKLLKEEKDLKEQLGELDKKVFRYFYKKAQQKNCEQQLIAGYRKMFDADDVREKDYKIYASIADSVSQFYVQNTYEVIEGYVRSVKVKEKDLITRLKKIMADEDYADYISSDQWEKLNAYLQKDWIYFHDQEYKEKALEHLNNALGTFFEIANQRAFKTEKTLLEWKLSLLN